MSWLPHWTFGSILLTWLALIYVYFTALVSLLSSWSEQWWLENDSEKTFLGVLIPGKLPAAMGLLCFAGLKCLAAKLPLSAQLATVCVQGWPHGCTTCVVKQGRVFRRPLHLGFMFCSYCFEILNTLRTRGQHSAGPWKLCTWSCMCAMAPDVATKWPSKVILSFLLPQGPY